ncbi:MAG: hypothetical protein IJT73_10770 [Selenomonadaceae bacterium]|nr:hypothetical protein [Selenomonadaceae bacterium]
MSARIDLTGQTFGRLTVLSYSHTDKRGKSYWHCKCSCGQECVIEGNRLRSGKTQSCGCLRNDNNKKNGELRIKNLIGQKFGKLTVISFEGRRGNYTYWKCRCECGTEKIATTSTLISGHITSCGCSKAQNLVGQTFGRLTVLGRAENKSNKTAWLCQCACGNKCIVQSYLLTHGITKSCGCLSRELSSKRRKTHGMTKTKIYKSWNEMKRRCSTPSAESFADYGGRGIKVCERWLKFETFYEDVSKLPHFGEKGYTLDRINNDGNYEPANVRWADKKTQSNNTRRNVIVKYQGNEMTLPEAAEKSGIEYRILTTRIYRGETGEYLFRLPKK